MSRADRQSRARKFALRCLKAFFKAMLLLWILTLVEVAALRYVDPPFTLPMVYDRVEGLFVEKPYDRIHYHWRDLKRISPHLIRAVQAAEDQRFLAHNGFDLIEMDQALRDHLIRSKRMRGASTISMQAARSVFLWPGRSLVRKGLEAYYTVLIELLWGKKRIMEMYLNTVDWGNGIIGAEAASKRYFRTSAASLNASQSALLASVLPNPHMWSPARPTEYVKERQEKILGDMDKMPYRKLVE